MNHTTIVRQCAICLLVICLGVVPLAAQTKLQVVTKTLEKTVPYQNGYEVNIEGEKAEIFVDTWDEKEVKVVVELIAKNSDRKKAIEDLEAFDFSAQQYGKRIYFRNYIKTKDGSKPTSSLKAIYTVMLPRTCPVYLKNNFGEIQMKNVNSKVQVNSEFSPILLENLSGNINVMTRFGDLEGNKISGNVQVNARRADVTFREIAGNFDIQSQYGVVNMFTSYKNSRNLNLNIVADKSDVYFFDPEPTQNGYVLTAHYGNITAPNALKFNYIENSTNIKKAVFAPSKEMASISIKISFGDIIIRQP